MRPVTSDTKPSFSLMRGGPIYRLLRRLTPADPGHPGHDARRMAVLLVAVTWLPLLAVALTAKLVTGTFPTLFADFAVQARLLLACPLFILAEQVVGARTERCIQRFTEGRFAEEGPEAVERLTAVAERRRDAIWPELLAGLLAVTGSALVLRGMVGEIGLMRGRALISPAPALKVWYGLVGLPLYQFLLYRWLWRWAIWSRLLWSLSRLRLRPLATHPDRRGGLSLLAGPSVGLALVVLAVCCVQAGVWADHVVFSGGGLAEVKAPLAVMLVLSLSVAFAPLLPFARPLWNARYLAIRQYDALALDLVRLFHARWVQRAEREGLLGSPDASTVADLVSTYQIIGEMRLVPVRVRDMLPVAAAVVAPTIPVILLRIPLVELLRKLGSIAVGSALPG
jgi:hypothetical protein